MTHPRLSALVLLALASLGPLLHADVASANAALQHGRADQAASLLNAEIAANPSNPEAYLLLCRTNYSVELPDPAVDACHQAVAHAPTSSDAHLWLARALGLKAEHSNPITAINIAKQVRAEFERAVELSPANVDAVSDLGQFYVSAPSFIGGAPEKASKLAASIQARDAARAHRLLALVAQKNDDLTTAEAEFKAAIDASHSPDAYIDLALFYQQEKMKDKIDPAVAAAIAADRLVGPPHVDAASILIDAHLSQQTAIQALRSYLKSDHQTDSAPAFKVHVQLGNLLAKNKDKEGARREYNAALALAANYAPARKALSNL